MTQSTDMVGEVVGTYRVISRVAAGGMGEVLMAEHTLLGKRVAIKFLLPSVSLQPTNIERFFDEARAATRIADPGIVEVHDFGWYGARAYIVMELLTGETLATRLARQGQLSLARALQLVGHAATTMAAVHAGGIIHRDLKPDNLFIVSDTAVPHGERIKILDFGIAKLAHDGATSTTRTQTGAILGTPMYMSPEQCRGAGEVDHRTDIYALGCVLYHALCGRPPFIEAAPGELIASHLMKDPVPPSAWNHAVAAVDELVLRCLEKVPGDRFATMSELASAIERASAGAVSTDVAAVVGRHSGAMAFAPTSVNTPMPQGPAVSPRTTLATGVGPELPSPRTRSRALAFAVVVAVVVAIIVLAWPSGGDMRREAPAASSEDLDALRAEQLDASVPIDMAASAVDALAVDASVRRPRGTRRDAGYDPYADP